MKTAKIKCSDIENLLIKKNMDQITKAEKILLQQHLNSCQNCRNFASVVIKLLSSMRVDERSELLPDPAIRQNIQKYMKTEKARTLVDFWRSIRCVLEYRITVYQGVLGIAVSVVLFLAVQNLSFNNSKPAEHQVEDKMEELAWDQFNVINDLQVIDQQKIGFNVAEDTILTQFIVTAM